jgi:hypothetical protein
MDIRNKITGINEILKTKLHSYFAQSIDEPFYTLAQETLVPLYETISDTYNFFQFLKNPRSYYDVVIAFSEAWFEKINDIYIKHLSQVGQPVDATLWSGYQQTQEVRDVFFKYFLANPFESGEENETA